MHLSGLDSKVTPWRTMIVGTEVLTVNRIVMRMTVKEGVVKGPRCFRKEHKASKISHKK